MGYKKIAHKSKEEGKIKRCVECLRTYHPEPEDDGDTCPRCAKRILVQMLEEDAERAKEGPKEIRMNIDRNPAYDGPEGIFSGYGDFDDIN